MAQNTITIDFTPCEPTPSNGYRIYYRPVGGGAYRFHPDRFYVTPAVIVDNEDPIGTDYEGFIQGDCGNGKFGLPVPWTAENSSSEASGSESASGSGSASEGNPVMSNPFKLGTNSVNVCDPGITNLFWMGPGAALVPGNTMYLDSGLTTPVTGFSFISDSVGTEIFNLDSGTGVVGATTGSGC